MDWRYPTPTEKSSLLEPVVRLMKVYGISLTRASLAFTRISSNNLYPMASNFILFTMWRLNAKNPDIGSLIFIPRPCCAILVAPLLISFLLNGHPEIPPPDTYLDATTISQSVFCSSSTILGMVCGG